jgi:hypothetical protein
MLLKEFHEILPGGFLIISSIFYTGLEGVENRSNPK